MTAAVINMTNLSCFFFCFFCRFGQDVRFRLGKQRPRWVLCLWKPPPPCECQKPSLSLHIFHFNWWWWCFTLNHVSNEQVYLQGLGFSHECCTPGNIDHLYNPLGELHSHRGGLCSSSEMPHAIVRFLCAFVFQTRPSTDGAPSLPPPNEQLSCAWGLPLSGCPFCWSVTRAVLLSLGLWK